MALSHGNVHSEPAKMEQIITEFFAKSLHIVLESRCPYVSSRNFSGEQVLSSPSSSSSSSSSIRPRDKWFNLALRDCPAALENIDFWRQSNLEPMVVDVVLVQRPLDWGPENCSPSRGQVRNVYSKERYHFLWNLQPDEFGCKVKNEKRIERWVIQYETRKSYRDCGSNSKRWVSTSLHTLYKKTILLLRSLYLTVRLLPAYKVFRDLISSAQIRTFSLAHRVSSFIEPLTRREEAEMQKFAFTPIETSCGRMCITVFYLSSICDSSSEPSTPISPKFIPDYVGSPMADPLKRLPSLPTHPFGRRHSWSNELNAPPSAFPSPSPTYSESRAWITKACPTWSPPASLPHHFSEAPQVHVKNMSFDEYWTSPIFSPSPSPSPPTYYVRALLRSDSAPANIPTSRLGDSPSLVSNKQILPPPSNLSKTDKNSSLLQTGSAVDKLFSCSKDEAGRLPGVRISSNSSPQKSISRSSSRLSFEDNYDDSEFSGPFVVDDDDDMRDPGSRTGSLDQTGHQPAIHEPGRIYPVRKSQDAAVVALFRMLKKAPPLRQDVSESQNYTHSSSPQTPSRARDGTGESTQQAGSLNITSSTCSLSRTTGDALQELRGYREMRDLLLKQGGKSGKT